MTATTNPNITPIPMPAFWPEERPMGTPAVMEVGRTSSLYWD